MVLLVDDEDEVTELMATVLNRLGYTSLAVNGPLQALALFSDAPEKFDLVIVDEIMPGMRGTELARRIIGIKDDIPVILVTGYGGIIPEDEVRSSGIRATLTKPVLRDELKAVLDSLSINRKQFQS